MSAASAKRRQRAHYRKQLERWCLGEWTPPDGWAQMVVERFPDLVEEFRVRLLGPAGAAAARAEHERSLAPKVGERMSLPAGRFVVTRVTGRDFALAPDTRWNRFVVWLRVLLGTLFTREKAA